MAEWRWTKAYSSHRRRRWARTRQPHPHGRPWTHLRLRAPWRSARRQKRTRIARGLKRAAFVHVRTSPVQWSLRDLSTWYTVEEESSHRHPIRSSFPFWGIIYNIAPCINRRAWSSFQGRVRMRWTHITAGTTRGSGSVRARSRMLAITVSVTWR